MIHHVKASIDGLLKLSDKKMSDMFNMSASEIRKDLKEQKAKGHLYVGSDKCEGFDPVAGCPGHPTVNGKEITITAGLEFRNKNMPGYSFVVQVVTPVANLLSVRIVCDDTPYDEWQEPDWNLEHTQWAFEKGEYFIESQKQNKP